MPSGQTAPAHRWDIGQKWRAASIVIHGGSGNVNAFRPTIPAFLEPYSVWCHPAASPGTAFRLVPLLRARHRVTKLDGVPARWRATRRTGPNRPMRRPDGHRGRGRADADETLFAFCQRAARPKHADETRNAFCQRLVASRDADGTRFPFCQRFVPPCTEPDTIMRRLNGRKTRPLSSGRTFDNSPNHTTKGQRNMPSGLRIHWSQLSDSN